MTHDEQNVMEEKIARSLMHGGSLGRSEAVMLAHDIVLKLLEDYRIDPHPYLELTPATDPAPAIPYGAALEEVATQIERIRTDFKHLLFNQPKSTDDPMGVVK